MASEFPFRIPLTGGLRPHERIRRAGSGTLIDLIDLRPSEFGLYPLEGVTDAITSPSITISWPFPQLVRAGTSTLLLDDTAIYTVVESTGVATQVITYDAFSTGDTKAILSGTSWHVAAVEDMYILTNGTSVVFNLPGNDDNKTLTSTTGTMQALGMVGERILVGGLAGDRFSDSDWTELLALWKSRVEDDIITHTGQAMGTNWIVYSAAGGGGNSWPFTGFLLLLGHLPSADYTSIKSAILTLLEKGEIGMFPLPDDSGDVLVIKELGEGAIAYTQRGVYRIVKAENGFRIIAELLNIGIPGRGAVGGDKQEHVFVDNLGVVRRIELKSRLERLGYEEYTAALTLSSINITFDSDRRDYYISDGSNGLLLTVEGMCKITELPTSVIRTEAGVLAGVKVDGGTAFTIETGNMDMDVRGLKDIKFAELESTAITSPQMALVYKYGQNDTEITTPWIYGSPEGLFYLGISMSEARFKVKGTIGSDGKVESITGRTLYADNRGIHGTRGTGAGGF